MNDQFAIPEEYPRPIVLHKDGRLGGPHKKGCRCEKCVDYDISSARSVERMMQQVKINAIREHLQVMISSSEVFVSDDDTITGYKIKTGALHRLIGLFSDSGKPLHIPTNLPLAGKP